MATTEDNPFGDMDNSDAVVVVEPAQTEAVDTGTTDTPADDDESGMRINVGAMEVPETMVTPATPVQPTVPVEEPEAPVPQPPITSNTVIVAKVGGELVGDEQAGDATTTTTTPPPPQPTTTSTTPATATDTDTTPETQTGVGGESVSATVEGESVSGGEGVSEGAVGGSVGSTPASTTTATATTTVSDGTDTADSAAGVGGAEEGGVVAEAVAVASALEGVTDGKVDIPGVVPVTLVTPPTPDVPAVTLEEDTKGKEETVEAEEAAAPAEPPPPPTLVCTVCEFEHPRAMFAVLPTPKEEGGEAGVMQGDGGAGVGGGVCVNATVGKGGVAANAPQEVPAANAPQTGAAANAPQPAAESGSGEGGAGASESVDMPNEQQGGEESVLGVDVDGSTPAAPAVGGGVGGPAAAAAAVPVARKPKVVLDSVCSKCHSLEPILEEFNDRTRLLRGEEAMELSEFVSVLKSVQLEAQGGKCGVCAFPLRCLWESHSIGYVPSVNVDPVSGFPRGLTCPKCTDWLTVDNAESVILDSRAATRWPHAHAFVTEPPWNQVCSSKDMSPAYSVEIRSVSRGYGATTLGSTRVAAGAAGKANPSSNKSGGPANKVAGGVPGGPLTAATTALSEAALMVGGKFETGTVPTPDALPPLSKSDRRDPTVLANRIGALTALSRRIVNELSFVQRLYVDATEGVWAKLPADRREKFKGADFGRACEEQFMRAVNNEGLVEFGEVETVIRIISALSAVPVKETPSRESIASALDGFRVANSGSLNLLEFTEFTRLQFAMAAAAVLDPDTQQQLADAYEEEGPIVAAVSDLMTESKFSTADLLQLLSREEQLALHSRLKSRELVDA